MARKRICIDCRRLTPEGDVVRGRCPSCRRGQDRQSFYQSPEWKRLRSLARRLLRPRQCAICGSTWRLTLHHKVPRAQGGADSLDNLCWLCGECHSQYEGDKRAGRSTGHTTAVDALAAAPSPRFFRGHPSGIAPNCARENLGFGWFLVRALYIRARARLVFLFVPNPYRRGHAT